MDRAGSLRLQPDDFARIEALQGVACVHDQPGLLHQGSIVECPFALDDHDAIRRGSHGPAVPPRACAHPIAASARADRYSLSARLVARAAATDPTRATPERHRYCVYGPRPEAERTDRTAILYGRAVNPVPALIGRLHRIYWLYVAQLKESSRPIDST